LSSESIDSLDKVERVERDECVELCFSNMADDEEAVVLACTSLVFLCFARTRKEIRKKTTRCVGERLSGK